MREKIKLLSTADTGHFYGPPRTAPASGQDGMRKFDPVVRKHVAYKETKIK